MPIQDLDTDVPNNFLHSVNGRKELGTKAKAIFSYPSRACTHAHRGTMLIEIK